MFLNSHPFLIAAIVQTFLYAIYVVTLGHALHWLLYDGKGPLRRRSKVYWLLVTTTIIVFVFSTADMILEISLQLTFAGGLDGGSSEITQQLIIASVSIEIATLLITDAVLIIRCWLVYQRSWRIICFPFTLWLANVTCMALWIAGYTMTVLGEAATNKPLPHPPLQVFYSFNFITSIYATGTIVHRIWHVARETNSRSSAILKRVCRIVAGTGILYTSSSLPLVISAFLIETYKPIYILCDAITFSFAGITFNLLLIRVGQLRAEIDMELHRNIPNSPSTTEFSNPDTTANDGSVTMQNDVDANLKEREQKISQSLVFAMERK